MLNETREKIKETFSVLCPEIILSEKEFNVYVDLVAPMLSESVFRDLYITAFVYLMAHHITMRRLIAMGGDTGAANLAVTGLVTSEKEGDLQRTYASASSNPMDTLERTYYGLEYKRICAMCIVPVVTRLENVV